MKRLEENRMRESKSKICKIPKCQKEVPGEKGVFCGEHSKSVKENGKVLGSSALAMAGLAFFVVTKGQELISSLKKE